jgi:hypothetical protein
MFKVRKWSDTNSKPYDVVYLDYAMNNQHYQPGADFSTKELAEAHRVALVKNFTPNSLQFIRDHWPTDGGIE